MGNFKRGLICLTSSFFFFWFHFWFRVLIHSVGKVEFKKHEYSSREKMKLKLKESVR